MKILAVETTCDETSAAVLEDGRLLSNYVHTQIPLHSAYNGVVPELASRAHLEKMPYVLKTALAEAGIKEYKKAVSMLWHFPAVRGFLVRLWWGA